MSNLMEAYYTVETVSERLGVRPALVRRYTRLGFIVPSARAGRGVLYSEADLALLRRIVRLRRDLGLNVAGVETVLRLVNDMEALQRELAELRARHEG